MRRWILYTSLSTRKGHALTHVLVLSSQKPLQSRCATILWLTVSASISNTEMSLSRPVVPATISSRDFGMLSTSERNSISFSLASPSTGGAAIWILMVPSGRISAILSRLARGVTRTAIAAPVFPSCKWKSRFGIVTSWKGVQQALQDAGSQFDQDHQDHRAEVQHAHRGDHAPDGREHWLDDAVQR